MSSTLDRAAARAAREVAELLGQEHLRVAFKVERFERHADGYLHARVLYNGRHYYVHRRYGSWQMPGHIAGRAVCREVLYPFNAVLQEHARPFDDHLRREREAREIAARKAQNPAGRGAPAPTAGAPEGGDRRTTV